MLAVNALTTLERMKLMLGLTNKDASLDKLKLMLGLSADSEIPPEQLEQMLGVAEAENEQTDLIIELLINKASSWIERLTGRHLGKQSYHQWYDADGSQELVLIEYPIVSIESIREDGKLVDPRRYDYGQTGHIGVVYRDEGWLRAGWRRGLTSLPRSGLSRWSTRRDMCCQRTPLRTIRRPFPQTLKVWYGIWWRRHTPVCRTAHRD